MKHVLICRTDNIGDVVLTLPLAGYLKRTYPGIKVGMLCRRYAASMVRRCRAVDYVLEVEDMTEPVAYLQQAEIDTIIFAMPNKKLAAAAKKAKIQRRVGTSRRLFHWLYCNQLAHFSRVKSDLHEAQLNFKLLTPLGIHYLPDLKEIPDLYQLDTEPSASQQRMSAEKFNLIIHPKSNGNGREWPIEHYFALARQLSTYHEIQLWLTGSKDEGAWIKQHMPHLLDLPHVTNVCGLMSLDELIDFIHCADGLIASGTGPVHISAALGKPTLGLFPPVRPIHPGRWAPLGVQAQVLSCATGCGKCKDSSACACMHNILPEQVADVVLAWKNQQFSQRSRMKVGLA